MTLVRSQIIQTVRQADVPRDYCVNDVYHQIATGIVWGGADFQNHANEIRDLFAGKNTTSGATFQTYSGRGLTVKCYDMADPKPRQIKGQATYVPTTWQVAALGPREIACCLSYYGTNPGIPSQRGRIYIGPFTSSLMTEVIDPTIRNQLTDLGHGLFDIGGQNVKHVVHSPTKMTDTTVQNYWVNDLWDVIRKREQKEQARTRLAP